MGCVLCSTLSVCFVPQLYTISMSGVSVRHYVYIWFVFQFCTIFTVCFSFLHCYYGLYLKSTLPLWFVSHLCNVCMVCHWSTSLVSVMFQFFTVCEVSASVLHYMQGICHTLSSALRTVFVWFVSQFYTIRMLCLNSTQQCLYVWCLKSLCTTCVSCRHSL